MRATPVASKRTASLRAGARMTGVSSALPMWILSSAHGLVIRGQILMRLAPRLAALQSIPDTGSVEREIQEHRSRSPTHLRARSSG
jgi:hypothetical protein